MRAMLQRSRGCLGLTFLCFAQILGCTGTIGTTVDEEEVTPELEMPAEGSGEAGRIECEGVGPRLLRRLSSHQYRATLLDLFDGDPNVPDADVLTDPAREGFRIDASESVVTGLGAHQLMTHAEAIAEWAVQTHGSRLSECQEHSDQACRQTFIETFGARAYRHPLTAETVEAYDGLFTAEANFNEGMEAVISTMIQSPHFLYRQEIGVMQPDGSFALDSYEVATNLAYTLTNAPPDEMLREAAGTGTLTSSAEIDRHFDRLLATPAAQENFGEFVLAWLDVEDLPKRAKDETLVAFGSELRHDMLEETEALFVSVLAEGGPVAELFSADYSFLNQRLREHYGMGGGSEAMERMSLDGARPRGILGHGSVHSRHALAALSSPVMRGLFVRERLLCETLPAPPPGVDTNIVPADAATMSTRQRYMEHSENAACAGCHARMDPIGFAFEHFDAFGQHRSDDGGGPVDATGELTMDGMVPAELNGIDSLSERLAESSQVHECLAHYLTYYAYGLDECGGETVATGTTSVKELLRAIVQADHFRFRREP